MHNKVNKTMRRIVLSLIVLGLSVFSCEDPLEDRVEELENQLAQYEQLQVLVDSLFNVLFQQQAFIDSLDTKHQAYVDSLHVVHQELIEMLISGQPITGSGDNFVRINNVQICWGSGMTNISGTTVTFPSSFAEIPIVLLGPTNDEQLLVGVKNITLSSAEIYFNTIATRPFNYHAIGFWY
jgi:hypothetical protein